MAENYQQQSPDVPPPPPRQPDEALKGYIERENSSDESADGKKARTPAR